MLNSIEDSQGSQTGEATAPDEALQKRLRYNRNVSNWTVIVVLMLAVILLYYPVKALYVVWVEHEKKYYQEHRMRL